MKVRQFTLFLCLMMMLLFCAEVLAFRFKDATGKIHTLEAYKGKWVLVNFWATWCPPCLKEIPDLVALYESRQDIMVIGVAMDYADSKTVMEFVESMSISYPTVLGDRHIAAQIDDISMLPSTYFYNPAGQPAARKLGLITREGIEEFVNSKTPDSKHPQP